MLVIAVHDCLGDQSIEFGVTERRHPRRIENCIWRFTSSCQQQTTGPRFACKINVGRRGLEPRTYGLKVHSSAIELAARGCQGTCRLVRGRIGIPVAPVFQQVVTHEADIGVASFEQATGVGTMNTGWHTRRSLAVMIMSDNSDQPISAGTLRQHG
jgi:hypothetical protein